MDKIFSTRVDESVILHIGLLAQKLGTTKKAVIENAVREYAERMEKRLGFDVLTHTCGSWRREESAAETVRSVKNAMRSSQERHKR